MKIIMKLTYSIFMSSNNFSIIFFITHLKMFKNSSAKYYQKDKERLLKKPAKDI